VNLRVGKQAQQQITKAEAWWIEHRPAAPTLFLDELEATFQYICAIKGAGVRWPTQRHPNVRRILMPRTNNHIYFIVDEATNALHVLAIWGAPKGRTPKL
jgi:hypothetical protein